MQQLVFVGMLLSQVLDKNVATAFRFGVPLLFAIYMVFSSQKLFQLFNSVYASSDQRKRQKVTDRASAVAKLHEYVQEEDTDAIEYDQKPHSTHE